MIPPNDFGTLTLDECQSISIDDFVSEVNQKLKKKLLESKAYINDVQIDLTTTKTNFSGTRFWFLCPSCKKRVGKVYLNPLTNTVGCRNCLQLPYRKSRFHNMIEEDILE